MKHVIYNPMPAAGDRGFVRGFVAAGCISAFQDVENPMTKDNLMRVARQSLQGGVALAAGTGVVHAIRRQDYMSAIVTLATGAAGVYVIEQLMKDKKQNSQKDSEHG